MSSPDIKSFGYSFAAPFALTGFAIAEPVFEVLRQTPDFLLARQNTVGDVWAITAFFSLALPLLLTLPAWLTMHRWRLVEAGYRWAISSLLSSVFIAQLMQGVSRFSAIAFVILVVSAAAVFSWSILFTRWKMLALILAGLALIFPLRMLFFSDAISAIRGTPASSLTLAGELQSAPDIVFVILDELPLASMLDEDLQIDAGHFPGFRKLQETADWYFNTTTVANATLYAVPAIVNGLYPMDVTQNAPGEQAPNLFTLLSRHYDLNVTESYTRLCPERLCPAPGAGAFDRFRTLVMDLAAIILHQATPEPWLDYVPDVTGGWSGFFAEGAGAGLNNGAGIQRLRIWGRHVGDAPIDRPTYFRHFISSIRPGAKPRLHFIHIPFPHKPIAHLPGGENYGSEWIRGQQQGRWGSDRWSLVSGRQRYFLQYQLADRLVLELLEHLERQSILKQSLVVVAVDHGVSFNPDDWARKLSAGNSAGLLRVPLFIKSPGQTAGRRIEGLAMTVDVLPTLLEILGADTKNLTFDGIDLRAVESFRSRTRWAYDTDLKRQQITEAGVALEGLVSQNRSLLKLDDESSAIWQIGPIDSNRGRLVSALCQPVTGKLALRMGKQKLLPNSRPENYLPALVSGTIIRGHPEGGSRDFIVTSENVIVSSGHTILRNGRWQFSVMVPPRWVKQPGWSPRVSLVVGDTCLMQ